MYAIVMWFPLLTMINESSNHLYSDRKRESFSNQSLQDSSFSIVQIKVSGKGFYWYGIVTDINTKFKS